MRNTIYILLFLISFNGLAQEKQVKFADKAYYLVDSLVLEDLIESDQKLLDKNLNLFHKSKLVTEKISALNDICENMMHDDWEKYQFYQYNFVQKALAKNPSPAVKNSLMTSYAGALVNLGIIFENQGNIAMAVEHFHKGLHIQEMIKDSIGIATTFNNLGSIYYYQDDISLALNYYHKSLAIKEAINDLHGASFTLNNIGNIHFKQGNIDTALIYMYKCLEIDEKFGDKQGLAQSYNNIGGVYSNKGDLKMAIQYYEKSLKMREAIDDQPGISQSLYNLGSIQLKNNELNKALTNGLRSLSIAKIIGFPYDIKNGAALLSRVYEEQGNGMKSLEMYKLYVKMKDSINNEATQKATIRQQAQYEFEKAQIVKENEAKEKTRIEVEATGRRNNLQYSLIFLGILLLFGIVLSLGFIKVSPNVAEGLIFFAFLILFEFILVFTDPYLQDITHDEPMYNLAANAIIALLIFPLHAILEKLLKKRIVK